MISLGQTDEIVADTKVETATVHSGAASGGSGTTKGNEDLRQQLFRFYSTYSRYYTANHYYQLNKLAHRDSRAEYLLGLVGANDEVLEVGSASGVMSLEASRLAGRCTGLDLSPLACQFASEMRQLEFLRHQLIEKYESVSLNASSMLKAQFISGDAETLPFKNDSFDIIFSRETLEHVPRPYAALDEMVRCLRPGGQLILEIPIPTIAVDLRLERWLENHGSMGDRDAVSRIGFRSFRQWVCSTRLSRVHITVIYNRLGLRRLSRWFPLLEDRLLRPWQVLIWAHLRKPR